MEINIAANTKTTSTPYVVTHDRISSTVYILSIEVQLERNSLFYNQLISVPLIGMGFQSKRKTQQRIQIFHISGAYLLILLSFWVDSFLRLILNAISLIVLIGMLLVLADHGPNHYTPTVGKYFVCGTYFIHDVRHFQFQIFQLSIMHGHCFWCGCRYLLLPFIAGSKSTNRTLKFLHESPRPSGCIYS